MRTGVSPKRIATRNVRAVSKRQDALNGGADACIRYRVLRGLRAANAATPKGLCP